MISQRRIPRLSRWAVPAGAVALTGIVIGGYAISGAQAAPSLPSRTPVQLLAAVNSARVPPPMTAVIQESAALGIPDLPSSVDPMSGLSWLSGTHTIKIWYADQAHVRIAVPVPLGESDIRRDGRDVWSWNSKTSQVTHLVLPARASGAPQDGGQGAGEAGTVPTPQQVARQLLAAIGPTTKVGLQQNVTIAGQAAYQISLAPRDSRSLIGEIRIAIDARLAMPLRVQIFARGSGSPAFQVGFTALQFGTPAAANFAFTPPPGAKVKTVTVPGGLGAGLLGLPGMARAYSLGSVTGVPRPPSRIALRRVPALKIRIRAPLQRLRKGGPVVVRLPARGAKLTQLRRAFAAHLPRSLTAAQRKAALKRFDSMISRRGGLVMGVPALGVPGARLSPGGLPSVLGKDWLTVVVLPASGLSMIPEHRMFGSVPVGPAGPTARVPAGHAAAFGHAQIVMGTPGPEIAMLGALLRAATPVHGSWGSGRLLTTSLVSALITSNGRMLIGAVTPAVLYADAAQLK